jgi:alpha-L-arabinofuranosidase
LTVVVNTAARGLPVAPTLHGLFFEDINYGADGGLYAELVQNRSFEHGEPLFAWSEVAREGGAGKLTIASDQPLNANNPRYLRLELPSSSGDRARPFGVANAGFDGIALRAGERYLFSLYARASGASAGPASLRVALEDADGHALGEARIEKIGTTWKKYELSLTSLASATTARLVVLADAGGSAATVDVDMVSLFPEKTFKNRRNGLRADLAQALADLRPGFLRFPGGCIVEGRHLGEAYRWKDTIGDVAERKQNTNLWADRLSPQYHQTYGLGFLEYFQFCEDIGAAPVPVVNCGMCCQARQGPAVPLDQLGPWVQDALDLIEFANGPVTSPWGARRAALGHPEPFHLKYLAVGNEQWNQPYFDRYAVFYRAIKAKYPEIQIISSSGPALDDPLWRFAWSKFNHGTPADIVDEHYYVNPSWLLANENRYARYDRAGPQVFVGEFAAHEATRGNTLRAALTEAAYMTGLWRNADVVVMASYAPLLAKYGRVQWAPNLIWFDNTRVVLTPSYHTQAMFSQNAPERVLPVRLEGENTTLSPFGGPIGVGTWHTQAEFKDIKVTAADGRVLFASDFTRGTEGWKPLAGDWAATPEGTLRQSAEAANLSITTGDTGWTDYTLTLRARKIAGAEGFLVFFGNGEGGFSRWNLGGWSNKEHGLDTPADGMVRIPGTIETGRWYDLKVELRGVEAKCYLDGKLLQQATRKATRILYATAGRAAGGDYVVQIVNPTRVPISAMIELAGLDPAARGRNARLTVLTGQPAEENSLEAPTRIAPRDETIALSGEKLTRNFPAWSATVLRIPHK